MKKFLFRILLAMVIVVISTWSLATYVLPYAIISREKRIPDLSEIAGSYVVSQMQFITKDSLTLKASYVIPEGNNPDATIICLHGIGGNRLQYLSTAKKLAEKNIATVLLDLRAHGLSEGDYITYGYYEKQDVIVIVDTLLARGVTTPIGVWGNSLGGAIALQSLALDSRLDFGIVESTFINMNQVVYDYQERYSYGLSLPFLCDISLDAADDMANFDHEEVAPLESVKKIEQPLLIAHGTADERIPIAYGEQLFDSLASEVKVFYPVEGAGHKNLKSVGGDAYYDRVFEFIEKEVLAPEKVLSVPTLAN